VLIGNLPIDDLGTSDALSATSFYGVGFQTDAGSWNVTDLKLDLTLGASTAAVDIRTGTFNTPSGTAGFSSWSVSGPSGSTYTFTPTATLTLNPSTYYWIVVGANGAATWLRNTADIAYTTSAGFTYLGTKRSSTGGASWIGGFAGGQPGLELNAVPEPREYALLAGLGLLGFAVWRRVTAAKTVCFDGLDMLCCIGAVSGVVKTVKDRVAIKT
jgi:hypothetical protein